MGELSLHYDRKTRESRGWALTVVSFLSFFAFLTAAKFLDGDEPKPNASLIFLALSVCMGFYVLLCLIESNIGKYLATFKTTLVAWAVLVGVFTYIGRIGAVSDINRIFHIDASAFPLTLFASTAIHVAVLLFWPIVVMLSFVLLLLIVMWKGDYFGNYEEAEEKFSQVIPTVVIACTLGFSAFFIYGRLCDDENRSEIIYRIAHASDFSSSFRCLGLSEEEDRVLFIGPDQRRVLVAPKIVEPILSMSKKAEILKDVYIPKEFRTVDCIPSVVTDLDLIRND